MNTALQTGVLSPASWKGWMFLGRKEMSKEDGLKQEQTTSYEEDERYQVKKTFFSNT